MEKIKVKILRDTVSVVGTEYWKSIYDSSRTTVRELCEANIPRLSLKKKNDDWFEKNRAYLIKLIRKKRNDWTKYSACVISSSDTIIVEARKNEWVNSRKMVRKECRRLRKDFWVELAKEMQSAFDNNETGLFFAQTKKIFGPLRAERSLVQLTM
jgi:hypothetical protein